MFNTIGIDVFPLSLSRTLSLSSTPETHIANIARAFDYTLAPPRPTTAQPVFNRSSNVSTVQRDTYRMCPGKPRREEDRERQIAPRKANHPSERRAPLKPIGRSAPENARHIEILAKL